VISKGNGKAVRDSRELIPGETVNLRFYIGSAMGSIISIDSDKKTDVAF
jgi:hypothetical protein